MHSKVTEFIAELTPQLLPLQVLAVVWTWSRHKQIHWYEMPQSENKKNEKNGKNYLFPSHIDKLIIELYTIHLSDCMR